jgi:hypothetical protein
VTLISAWLLFLVMNFRTLATLIKNKEERTPEEATRVAHGLFKETCLEFFVLVPASAALLILLKPLFLFAIPTLKTLDSGNVGEQISANAILGMTSYGFPFGPLRERISNALQAVVSSPTDAHRQKEIGGGK